MSLFIASPISVQLSSTSDLGPKGRSLETSVAEMQSQHDNNPYGPTTRAALPSITTEQPVSNYSGKHNKEMTLHFKSNPQCVPVCFNANITLSRMEKYLDKLKCLRWKAEIYEPTNEMSQRQSLFSIFHRKPNHGCLCHPSHEARLLRILCVHTAHLLPQSLLDVLSTWTRGCAATVGRFCKEAHFARSTRAYCRIINVQR